MRERRHTCGTSSERIEKAPKVVVSCALQPDTGEKVGIGPFDPDLSDRPTRVVPVDRVVDLLRVPHAHDRIRMYRKAMDAGDRFPPISVIKLGGVFVIADGHKRFVACSGLGLDVIVVELWGFGTLSGNLLAQMWGQIRKGATVMSRLHHGPKARRRACWYVLSFFYHWKRMFASLRRSTPPNGAGTKR